MLTRMRRAMLVGMSLVGAALVNPAVSTTLAASTLCPSSIEDDIGGGYEQYVFQYECGEPFPGSACYRAPGLSGTQWEYAMFDCDTQDYVGDCDASSCRMTY